MHAPRLARVIMQLEVRHAARQSVPDIEVDGVVVRTLRSPSSYEPWTASQPFVLTHHVDGAIAGACPHGLVEAKRKFIDCTVLVVGGTGVTISDGLAGGVNGDIAANVISAVIRIEQGIFNSRLETVYSAIGLNSAKGAIGPNDQVRCLPE